MFELFRTRSVQSMVVVVLVFALLGTSGKAFSTEQTTRAAPISRTAALPTGLDSALAKAETADNARGARYAPTLDPYTQQAELSASDGAAQDNFGVSVALSSDGSTALIGAFLKTVTGRLEEQGAVYVFNYGGSSWTQQAELTAADGAGGDWFGESIALSSDGDTALVGAPGKTVNGIEQQGAAYIFINSGGSWTQQAKLTVGDGALFENFGVSVALSDNGSTALIGTINVSKAYLFTRSSQWAQQAELTASGGFGVSVALSSDGSTALVGAPGNTVDGSAQQGTAYVFSHIGATWLQQAELTPSNGAANDNFGRLVALSSDGSTALVGAPGKMVNGLMGQGAAYLFTSSGGNWMQQAELTAGDGMALDRFGGWSMVLSDNGGTALVGGGMGRIYNWGAMYVFVRSGSRWTQQTELTANDGAANDNFGRSVALANDDNTVMIGANGKNHGVMYVFGPTLSTSTPTSMPS